MIRLILAASAALALSPSLADAASCYHDGVYYGSYTQICSGGALMICTSGGYWSTTGWCHRDSPANGSLRDGLAALALGKDRLPISTIAR